MSCSIRNAVIADARSINDIANWYIEHTAINFDIEPWDLDQRTKWLASFTDPTSPYTVFVAEDNGEIVGFSYSTSLKPKPSYQGSVETTLYCAYNRTSQGYGYKLYDTLLTSLKQQSFHRAYAFIVLPNESSIKLHEYFNYNQIGILNEVGYKLGQFHSVALYETKL